MVELPRFGLHNLGQIHHNLSTPALYEQAVHRHEGMVAHLGPLVVRTGSYTGRSPKEKFTVKEPTTQGKVWWGKENRPFDPARYELLKQRLVAYFQGREVFVQDCYAGADKEHQVHVRVVTEKAWHNMFARNMFVRELNRDRLKEFQPAFTVLQAPSFRAVPEIDGTASEAFILVHLGRKEVIIGGTHYAGEIKKSVFSMLNYVLPQKQVLGMHCSANIGQAGDVALFFGLSGTGKTTLSADPERRLIGDDEHGWSDQGIFNFEGGCYAKVIRLSPEAEPEIFDCTRRFGTILENVPIDPETRHIDLDDDTYTENTRAAYPITHIPNCVVEGQGDHPSNVIMLTADAFGVLPPVAKLTRAQAMFHFLSGYTAKVAGTERGVTEPKATFSACFGSPFLTLNPNIYADLLGQKIEKHDAECWLINTGWTGGPYGTGHRMPIAHTRAMVKAALDGSLAKVECVPHPVFKVLVPKSCPNVPAEVLDPRTTWQDAALYDKKAAELAAMFVENFKEYEADATDEVKQAAPAV